jgi:hypothetical protein
MILLLRHIIHYKHQILAVVSDNATSNDTQMTALSNNPNNRFEGINRVRCFNHTINLAVKALLRPFQTTTRRDGTTASLDIDDFDLPELVSVDELDGDAGTEELDGEDGNVPMSDEERELALAQMDAVKTCLSKVVFSLFALIIN